MSVSIVIRLTRYAAPRTEYMWPACLGRIACREQTHRGDLALPGRPRLRAFEGLTKEGGWWIAVLLKKKEKNEVLRILLICASIPVEAVYGWVDLTLSVATQDAQLLLAEFAD